MKTFSEDTIIAHKRLKEAFDNLNVKGITILTGNNGSGKSLIRKQLPFKFKEEYNLSDVKDTKGMIKSTSMDARTGSNPEWGGLSGIMRDTEWVATSQNTLSAVNGLLSAVEKSEKDKTKYLVIDEYEIGCSEETVLALAMSISQRLNDLIDSGKIEGALIITHSRLGVQVIKHDHFINIEGLTENEWLNREVIPSDLNRLKQNELFFYLRDKKD